MATILTTHALMKRFPNPRVQQLSYNITEDLTPQKNAELKDMLLRATTRFLSDDPTDLLIADGTTPSDITELYMNYSAGNLLLGGKLSIQAADTDVILVGTGHWTKSFALDGTPAVVLTADGKTYEAALVAIIVDDTVELYAVFGDEADDGAQIAPTDTTITAALNAAGITDLETNVGMVFGRAKYARAASAITVTITSPATDAGLITSRTSGGLFGVQA